MPDPLDALDFTPEIVCEYKKQPYILTARHRLTGKVEPLPYSLVPVDGQCPNPPEYVIDERLCPCQYDVEEWEREAAEYEASGADGFVRAAGLFVGRAIVCASHARYFIHYLKYPFDCPQCGTRFLHPGEKLIGLRELDV